MQVFGMKNRKEYKYIKEYVVFRQSLLVNTIIMLHGASVNVLRLSKN